MSNFCTFGKFFGKRKGDTLVRFDDLSIFYLQGRSCVGRDDISTVLFSILVAVMSGSRGVKKASGAVRLAWRWMIIFGWA